MPYEVWMTQGQGGEKIADAKCLNDALQMVEDNKGSESFAIKYPDGTWHNWDTPNWGTPMNFAWHRRFP